MTAPQSYEAYARIFFPFRRSVQDENDQWSQQSLRWADLAEAHGRSVHALMEKETIIRPPGGEPLNAHCDFRLGKEQFEALLPVLARSTTSTMGWFLLWDGFGDLDDQVFTPHVPKVHHDMRSFYLLRGPLDSYRHFSNDPSYWWPDDRAWCLCTDTDFSWSCLAGSRECIDQVLALPVMDAVETRPEHPAMSGMDVLNDPEGVVPRPP